MLTARVIPCLDCRDGRVVKGIKFQGLRDAGCPVELSMNYERQGADELILLASLEYLAPLAELLAQQGLQKNQHWVFFHE